MKLTERQLLVLFTVAASVAERGYPPTLRELGDCVGIPSLRGVTTHLEFIQKKGCLTVEYAMARGITITEAGQQVIEAFAARWEGCPF